MARVDGIGREAGFVLMELEINEPFLYIGSSSGAAKRSGNTARQPWSDPPPGLA